MIIAAYGFLKAGWSLANDLIVRVFGIATYRPVPNLGTPEACAAYLLKNCEYTGDPGNGAVDLEIPAERLQAAMDRGHEAFKRLPVDCDDYAVWAVKALTLIGADARLFTLRCRINVGDIRNPANWGHHVIAVAMYKGRSVAIDTNGFHELPNALPSTLCSVWSSIYASRGYRYVEAVETANPFA